MNVSYRRHMNWHRVVTSFGWTLDTTRQQLVVTRHRPSIHLEHGYWYCGLPAHRQEHAIRLNKRQYKGNWYSRVVHPLRSFSATAQEMCSNERHKMTWQHVYQNSQTIRIQQSSHVLWKLNTTEKCWLVNQFISPWINESTYVFIYAIFYEPANYDFIRRH